MSSPLPTYTHIQLRHYFRHILLPESHRIYNIKTPALNPETTLSYLSLLQRLTLVTVPFENLSIHYSPSHHVDIDPEALFEKIVGRGVREEAADTIHHAPIQTEDVVGSGNATTPPRRHRGGRGGYCMENNRFFATILHSLGFDVYSVGARVHTPDGYNGWSHMVNLVKIADITYAVDIGFGGGGPTRPLPLCDPTKSRAERDLFETQVRSLYEGSDTNVSLMHRSLFDEPSARRGDDFPAQALWVYEVNKNESRDANDKPIWKAQYAFTETEFLPADFEMMSYYTSTSPRMWFTYRIVCARYLLEGDNGRLDSPPDEQRVSSVRFPALVDRQITGQISLDGEVVKRRTGNAIEVVEVCKTEAERVKVLEKWFGIRLTAEEQAGITGLVTELHGGATIGSGSTPGAGSTTGSATTKKRPRTEEGQVG